MKLSFKEEIKEDYGNFLKALTNIFIFLPYYFSVSKIIKTIFSPWKNLIFYQQKRGFNLSEWLSVKFSNLISRLIGFSLRISLLIIFAFIQTFYIILVPFLILSYWLLLPFTFSIKLIKPRQNQYQQLKDQFIKTHLANPKNLPQVEEWFLMAISKKKKKWWHLENLLSIPPCAKDWSKGFTPLLDQYVVDLTSSSYQNKIKDILGRKKEIDIIERSLIKEEDNNVLIVGEVGVGKRAILDGLAKRIYHGTSHSLLAYKRVLLLNLEKLAANFNDQKKIEFFFEKLLKEAIQAGNIILAIDNLDRYVTSQSGHIDLSIPLVTLGGSNKLEIIAFTTPYHYQKYIDPNKNIVDLFSKIELNEVSKEAAEKILLARALKDEKIYHLPITYETIRLILNKSQYYITKIPFPEKAIDLLENVFVAASENKAHQITNELVDKILEEITGAPVEIDNNLRIKLTQINQLIGRRILAQDEAVNQIATALQRAYLLRGQRKKPLASLLFLGPTGVGKTETAKTISKILMGEKNEIIRLDMANFQQNKDEEKLIGSFEDNESGYLSEKITKTPYNLLLIDEIEKARPNLRNLFLTILDEGYFTNSRGERIDCKNLIIVATSNAGAKYLIEKGEKIDQAEFTNYLQEANIFLPEFLNRFDKIIVFKPLTKESIIIIAQAKIKDIISQLNNQYQIKINVTSQFLTNLVNQKYNPAFGARGLEKLLQTEIGEKVASLVINNKIPPTREISLSY